MPRPPLFLDTSHVLAVASETDLYHARAVTVAAGVQRTRTRMVTTRLVLFEVGNAMSKRRNRAAGLRTLHTITQDPLIEIVESTPDLFVKAVNLFASRSDKEWGLVDCASFVVMQERGITAALTHDIHFAQAGFVALLR